jgi:hypothetical protein
MNDECYQIVNTLIKYKIKETTLSRKVSLQLIVVRFKVSSDVTVPKDCSVK